MYSWLETLDECNYLCSHELTSFALLPHCILCILFLLISLGKISSLLPMVPLWLPRFCSLHDSSLFHLDRLLKPRNSTKIYSTSRCSGPDPESSWKRYLTHHGWRWTLPNTPKVLLHMHHLQARENLSLQLLWKLRSFVWPSLHMARNLCRWKELQVVCVLYYVHYLTGTIQLCTGFGTLDDCSYWLKWWIEFWAGIVGWY